MEILQGSRLAGRRRLGQTYQMPRLDKTGAPRVTMSDVANLAQCSQSTVSVVLNDNASVRISADTRDRILKAAKQLGY